MLTLQGGSAVRLTRGGLMLIDICWGVGDLESWLSLMRASSAQRTGNGFPMLAKPGSEHLAGRFRASAR